MSANRILALLLRQLYLMRGSPSRIFAIFVWVALDMVLWGFITKYLNILTHAQFNFLSTLLGAILFWDFFTRVMHGVAIAFFEDVWSRNFLNYFAAPLSISEYLSGLVLSTIATSAFGLAVMVAIATALFKLPFFSFGLSLFGFLLILFMFGIALGVFASAVVLRFGPSAEWFIWPIPILLSPFAGVFYPLSTLPKWMQTISHFLPPSYVFESMRSIVWGSPSAGTGLLWSALFAGFYILLACFFFTRIFRHALVTGLIARYSAEGVSNPG